MRVYSIKRVLDYWPVGNFLEYGPGRGEITQWLLDKGHSGTACEISSTARNTLQEVLRRYQDQITICEDSRDIPHAHFDYLFAFEVLEHIEDDIHYMRNWVRYLKPNGRALFTVPAHQRKYGQDDEYVGHFRRYDRDCFVRLLQSAGLELDVIYNLGFPLGNITRIFSRWAFDYQMQDRTEYSGLERPSQYAKFRWLFNDVTMSPCNLFQCLFWKRDWGDNLLVLARKPH